MLTVEQERDDVAIDALVEARDAVDRALAAVPARGVADVLAKVERLAELIRENAGGEDRMDDCERLLVAYADSAAADLRRLAAN